jgi:hypothetical protein
MKNTHKYLEFKLTVAEIRNPPTIETITIYIYDSQKTHTNRHYYTFHIKPSIRT